MVYRYVIRSELFSSRVENSMLKALSLCDKWKSRASKTEVFYDFFSARQHSFSYGLVVQIEVDDAYVPFFAGFVIS